MDDVQPDTAPGDVRDGAGHREAGQEQELQQVAGGEGGYLLRRAQSAGDGRSGNAVDVDAHTVVLHLDDHSPARVVRAEGEDPAGGLTRADTGQWVLDAMADSVAHQVHQRILDRLKQGAVELGVAADHLEMDLGATGGGQVPNNSGHLGPEMTDGLHPRRHDPVLQLGGDQRKALGGSYQVGIGPGAHKADDLVARKHELADLAHEVVQNGCVDADRGVGRGNGPSTVGRARRSGGRDLRVGNLYVGDLPARGYARRGPAPA